MRNRLFIIVFFLIIGTVAGFMWRQTVLKERAERIAKNAPIEKSITIIPGWDLRDIARYLVREGLAKDEAEIYTATGKPATWSSPGIPTEMILSTGRPQNISLEGYLAPETYFIYQDATLAEIFGRLIKQRLTQFSPDLLSEITKQKRTVHEILTMASLLEKEVRSKEDKAKVADIFWRRHDVGMGLQADSTVHYAVAKEGTVFTTAAERASDNPWNTYKYPKLPPGPISNPGIDSIMAAIYPEKNEYWYFLTTLDSGEVKYARTLGEHNANVVKYLRK